MLLLGRVCANDLTMPAIVSTTAISKETISKISPYCEPNCGNIGGSLTSDPTANISSSLDSDSEHCASSLEHDLQPCGLNRASDEDSTSDAAQICDRQICSKCDLSVDCIFRRNFQPSSDCSDGKLFSAQSKAHHDDALLDSSHNSRLLCSHHYVGDADVGPGTSEVSPVPDARVIVSVPCSIHSRKPPLDGRWNLQIITRNCYT